jgi:hypothetical protein
MGSPLFSDRKPEYSKGECYLFRLGFYVTQTESYVLQRGSLLSVLKAVIDVFETASLCVQDQELCFPDGQSLYSKRGVYVFLTEREPDGESEYEIMNSTMGVRCVTYVFLTT